MDQSRNRGRTCHRIGQPHIQRDLCRFTRHADQHEDSDRHNNTWHGFRYRRGLFEHLFKCEGSKRPEHYERSDQEAKVADPVGDKRFLTRSGIPGAVLAFVEPEADQQV